MEIKDYEEILNAMPETGVYVIREEDHGLLYFNRRVQEVSPEVRLGMACHDVWSGSCSCCPLLTIQDRQESRSISYNEVYGGVVELTATRTLWGGETSAFVVTVTPRTETAGYTYRKILHVDLLHDRCDVLKSDPEGWQPEDGSLSAQMARFARSGAIHPDDIERYTTFINVEHLRSAPQDGQIALSLIYRRRSGKGYRWNLMEIVPDLYCKAGSRFAILCVKDVHDVLREGLEREEISMRNQDLIRSLGEINFDIYTVDLNSGIADPIRVDGQMSESMVPTVLSWSELMRTRIRDRLNEPYQEEFERRFSLEELRQARADGQKRTEMLCQWHNGEEYRYISVTAYFGKARKGRSYTVLALRDVNERMQQELAHVKRDQQMAAILRSRFKMMTTVELDTGMCERTDLSQDFGSERSLIGDYALYVQNALAHFVHPDDIEKYWSILSLDHLREKAASVQDYAEEVCDYRQRREPLCWIELHVLYSRQKGHMMVNILGQDVTHEKLAEASQLKVLEDRSYIISSLSSLFFTTYYIDLETDSFRAVNQLRRVGDLLGDEVNCTAALQIYANHFIHPDDREEYLKIMSTSYLRENLRWWQPYVAVEYRRLSESGDPDQCGWVRATAVLARTIGEDIPSTVVYVAQDISDSRRPVSA